MLPAVAIWTDMNAVSEQGLEALDPGKFVHHAGCHEQSPRAQRPSIIDHEAEMSPRRWIAVTLAASIETVSYLSSSLRASCRRLEGAMPSRLMKQCRAVDS
jgi:hypothetical protein